MKIKRKISAKFDPKRWEVLTNSFSRKNSSDWHPVSFSCSWEYRFNESGSYFLSFAFSRSWGNWSDSFSNSWRFSVAKSSSNAALILIRGRDL
jgi:hypothetical protein